MEAEKFLLTKNDERVQVVADLDEISSKSSYIKLHGEILEFQPIEVEQFLHVSTGLASLSSMQMKQDLNVDDVVDAYYSLLCPVVKGLTKEMIRTCSQVQLGALVQHFFDHIYGRTSTEEKKKTYVKLVSQSLK